MKYWKYYRLTKKIQSRKYRDYHLLTPIYNLLGLCLLSLFSFATTFVNYPTLLLIHLFVFYITMAYNFPLVIRELALKKSDAYRTNTRYYLKLFIFLLFENNPMLPATALYFLITASLSLINFQKLLLLLYTLLTICTLLLMKLTYKKWLRTLGQLIILGMTIAAFSFQKWLLLSTLIICLTLVLWSTFFSKKPPLFVEHHLNFVNNKVSIYTVAWSTLGKRYPKILLGMCLANLLGFTLHRLFKVNLLGSIVFIGLLESELSLDEKYKYLHRYISKYYFFKHSGLNFIQRYLISHNFFRLLEISIYLVAFGLGNQTTLISLFIHTLVLITLGMIYYQAEEKMYIKQRKINGFFFQYGIFICLSILLYASSLM